MGIIKNEDIKAYILLESLIALAIMVFIVSLLLSALKQSQKDIALMRHKEEVVATGLMAIQTKQRQLELNGCHVIINSDQGGLSILENDQEILKISRLSN